MPDYCDYLIKYHEAVIDLLKVTHKYLHEESSPWRVQPNTTLGQIMDYLPKIREKLGSDPVDEMVAAALKVEETIKDYMKATGRGQPPPPVV